MWDKMRPDYHTQQLHQTAPDSTQQLHQTASSAFGGGAEGNSFFGTFKGTLGL